MKDNNSLAHTKWNCKYHIVFAPKYRRAAIYGKIRADIGKILRLLCERKKKVRKKNREWISPKLFFTQLENDFVQELRDAGYIVDKCENDILFEENSILTDIGFLKILYNNLLVNIYSYAEKNKTIVVNIGEKNGFLHITIKNYIQDKSEGSGYGTGICDEIMRGLKGCYKYSFDEDMYKVELFFTIKARNV